MMKFTITRQPTIAIIIIGPLLGESYSDWKILANWPGRHVPSIY